MLDHLFLRALLSPESHAAESKVVFDLKTSSDPNLDRLAPGCSGLSPLPQNYFYLSFAVEAKSLL